MIFMRSDGIKNDSFFFFFVQFKERINKINFTIL